MIDKVHGYVVIGPGLNSPSRLYLSADPEVARATAELVRDELRERYPGELVMLRRADRTVEPRPTLYRRVWWVTPQHATEII